MIDANKDQLIDQTDLSEIYASLGKNPSDKELDDMIKMAPGPINFTMFLTMFGEKLMGTDPEDVIKNAFQCFDDNGDGKLKYKVSIKIFYVRFTAENGRFSHFW